VSPRYLQDRPLAGDIRTVQGMILAGHYLGHALPVLPSGLA
jgi:hypothetical protein